MSLFGCVNLLFLSCSPDGWPYKSLLLDLTLDFSNKDMHHSYIWDMRFQLCCLDIGLKLVIILVINTIVTIKKVTFVIWNIPWKLNIQFMVIWLP